VMRGLPLTLCLLGALALVSAACSDDSGPANNNTNNNNNTKKDGGVVYKDGGKPSICASVCLKQKSYLCVKNSASKCTECLKDAHCKGNPGSLGGTCSTSKSGGFCVCKTNAECAGKTHGTRCVGNTAANKICGCKVNADCKAPMKCLGTLFGNKVCARLCTKNADCTSATYKYCDKATGKCTACRRDADCTSAIYKYCSLSLGKCVACKTNQQCASKKTTPYCDTSSGKCAECARDANCVGSGTYTWGNKCLTSTLSGKLCRCKVNSDCNGNPNGPTCYTKYSKCSCSTNADCKVTPYTRCLKPYSSATYKNCHKACTSNADCTSAAAPLCNTKSGACVACFTNANCGYNKPMCDTVAGTCFGCKTSADCKANPDGGKCDTKTKACVCATDTDCKGGMVWGPKCTKFSSTASTGVCRCSATADCKGSVHGPTCYAKYKKCSCAGDKDCKSKIYSKCYATYVGATYKHCRKPCTNNQQCHLTNEGYKVCNLATHTCAACVTDKDCTSTTSPYCGSAGTCVDCKTNAQCAKKTWSKICEPTKGCVDCKKSADCTNASLGKTCSKSGYCTCSSNAECAGNLNGKKCETKNNSCSCTADTDCPAGRKCTGSTVFGTKICK